MIAVPAGVRVYLAAGRTDMCKGMHGAIGHRTPMELAEASGQAYLP